MRADPPASKPFHVLAKPSGARCNLACRYCFYLSRERLYPGSRFRMSAELQERYVRQLLEAHADGAEVVVAWQGGEPTLLGLDFFRRAIELERRYARPGQRVVNTLQTNGTLLDAAWARFLKEHDVLVGVSIDGPHDLHDRYRVDRGGAPTLDRVLRGLEHLRREGVEWNALACVHAGNGDHGLRVYRFLRDDLGARFVQFLPVVVRAGEADAAAEPSVRPEQYGRFLVDVFEEWVRHDVGSVFVQAFDSALARWAGAPGGVCVHEEACGRQLALEHTGDVYPCDHFVEPRLLLGTIVDTHLRELAASPRLREFGSAKLATLPPDCLECDVRFACNGGCPKDRFVGAAAGAPGRQYLCAGYRAFFRHAAPSLRAMADLLAARRPPALVMRQHAAADARRGRNEPCTCGSGRKWKRCHGSAAAR